MKKQVPVLGGSFNPPTKAHYEIMKAAKQALGTDMGIYLPSSDAYVKRKMAKEGGHVYSEQDRYKMLDVMEEGKDWISVVEFGSMKHSGHTYESLCTIDDNYQHQFDLFLILGSDKLDTLLKWKTMNDLTARFHIILTIRGREEEEKRVKSHPFYQKYQKRLLLIQTPETVQNISSTKIREKAEGWKAMLHPDVLQMLQEDKP